MEGESDDDYFDADETKASPDGDAIDSAQDLTNQDVDDDSKSLDTDTEGSDDDDDDFGNSDDDTGGSEHEDSGSDGTDDENESSVGTKQKAVKIDQVVNALKGVAKTPKPPPPSSPSQPPSSTAQPQPPQPAASPPTPKPTKGKKQKQANKEKKEPIQQLSFSFTRPRRKDTLLKASASATYADILQQAKRTQNPHHAYTLAAAAYASGDAVVSAGAKELARRSNALAQKKTINFYVTASRTRFRVTREPSNTHTAECLGVVINEGDAADMRYAVVATGDEPGRYQHLKLGVDYPLPAGKETVLVVWFGEPGASRSGICDDCMVFSLASSSEPSTTYAINLSQVAGAIDMGNETVDLSVLAKAGTGYANELTIDDVSVGDEYRGVDGRMYRVYADGSQLLPLHAALNHAMLMKLFQHSRRDLAAVLAPTKITVPRVVGSFDPKAAKAHGQTGVKVLLHSALECFRSGIVLHGVTADMVVEGRLEGFAAATSLKMHVPEHRSPQHQRVLSERLRASYLNIAKAAAVLLGFDTGRSGSFGDIGSKVAKAGAGSTEDRVFVLRLCGLAGELGTPAALLGFLQQANGLAQLLGQSSEISCSKHPPTALEQSLFDADATSVTVPRVMLHRD